MSNNIKILEAKTPAEITACWPVLVELRPHLVEKEFIGRVQQQQKDEGYRLMYILDEEGTQPQAIMGFRILNFLWSGKTLYIDDLCTLSTAHRKGYGGKLLDFADQIANELNCECVSLDSGYTRNKAHRLYLNKRFELASHHFHKNLK